MADTGYFIRFRGHLTRAAVRHVDELGIHLRSDEDAPPRLLSDGTPEADRHRAWVTSSDADEALARVHEALDGLGHFRDWSVERVSGGLNRNPGWSYALHVLHEQSDARALVRLLDGGEFWTEAHAREALASLGDAALEPALELLRTGSLRGRINAARTLGDLKNDRAVTPLLAVLEQVDVAEVIGPEYELWASAAGALGQLRARDAVEHLVQALAIDDIDVRQDSAWALGEIGDRRAVQPLTALLGEREVPVVWAVAEALREIGGPDAERAVQAFEADEAQQGR